MRVPWTARRSNQSILEEFNLEYSLERLMLKLKGMTEDEMVGWHHRPHGYEFEQAPGDTEGQESLACCSPWGRTELDMTEQLNNNNKGKR